MITAELRASPAASPSPEVAFRRYVAAESGLTSALRLVQEAGALLPTGDAHLAELLQKIEHATHVIKGQGQAAAARLESVVETNERLLADLEQ
jgi:DNA repair protein RadC